MRITNNMLTSQFLYNINQAMTRMDQLQEQITNGKSINNPSDDPVRAVRSLKFHTGLDVNTQYTQNAQDAVSWMTTSDGAMTGAASVLTRVKELVVRATAPNPDVAFTAVAQELDGLINELVDLGNTQFGNRYVFAGQNDRTMPFTRSGDTVTYNGTYDGQNGDPHAGVIAMQVSPGSADPQRDKINADGQELFGPLDTTVTPPVPQMFAHLFAVKQHLLAGDTAALSNDLGILESDFDHLTQAQTALGARQAVYQNIQDRLKQDNVIITQDLSKNEDLDLVKASIDFQSSENVYRAALAVGAQILPPSLVDYLK